MDDGRSPRGTAVGAGSPTGPGSLHAKATRASRTATAVAQRRDMRPSDQPAATMPSLYGLSPTNRKRRAGIGHGRESDARSGRLTAAPSTMDVPAPRPATRRRSIGA